jgi:hypothetical protein
MARENSIHCNHCPKYPPLTSAPTVMDSFTKETLASAKKVAQHLAAKQHPHAALVVTLAAWIRTAATVGVEEEVLCKARAALLILCENNLGNR